MKFLVPSSPIIKAWSWPSLLARVNTALWNCHDDWHIKTPHCIGYWEWIEISGSALKRLQQRWLSERCLLHPSTPYCSRVRVCILSTGVLQMNCWPELPCPTCLRWLLLKKSLKISQCNIPRRGVTSVSLPKLSSHCNIRPRCEMSIWWLPGFNCAGADRVLGSGSAETSLLPTTTVTKHHSMQCLSGDPQHEPHSQSQRLSDTHLRILWITSALRFCLFTKAGLSPVHNNKKKFAEGVYQLTQHWPKSWSLPLWLLCTAFVPSCTSHCFTPIALPQHGWALEQKTKIREIPCSVLPLPHSVGMPMITGDRLLNLHLLSPAFVQHLSSTGKMQEGIWKVGTNPPIFSQILRSPPFSSSLSPGEGYLSPELQQLAAHSQINCSSSLPYYYSYSFPHPSRQ